jgi:hypothetical protein
MARATEHQTYGPGKFEGESCIARFGYNLMMNGFSDPMECNCEDTLREANDGEYDEGWECADNCQSRVEHMVGPFHMVNVAQFEQDTSDEMCQECIDSLFQLAHIDLEVSEQGFVYSSA